MAKVSEHKLTRQIEDLVKRTNVLIAERDNARLQIKELLESLRDIAYAPESKARNLARQILAKFDLAEIEPNMEILNEG